MNDMRVSYAAAVLLLALPITAFAAPRVRISPLVLAKAINEANAGAVPYRKVKIAPSDIRAVRCVGYDEEPTETECAWQQRTDHGWVKRTTGLAIDGTGWHVND